ncbi:hypothetical protein RLEG3_18685 [Rhizobium leguminosarum bv. trifolii WSM1689]|uniref:hypothetical protein n=1 Tax=Rhizobium leguminosarum TaxID=384 RepID=UPI0003E08F78|nr:hypothetical protein [Rhizobium leguminosarum]AHF86720.1 hypothetical protein RLEG3_18685 [Rhizobium leguminosarum bv. trifolii WSM1689]
MRLSKLRTHLDQALQANAEAITAHITNVLQQGRTTGIEAAFAGAFHKQLDSKGINWKPELPLDVVGVEQRYHDRTRGRVDCLIGASATALEYKAVRMPRTQPSPKFDLGQILADYMRLASGASLEYAYLVIFLYGPIVSDCSSPGSLYRRFHNQMFVDQELARQKKQLSAAEEEAIVHLGWEKAWGKPQPPEFAAAALRGEIGVVCVSALDRW